MDWKAEAKALESKSPLDAMDHALKTFGDEIAIAFSGAEDALIEYAKLTGRKFRVFRCLKECMQGIIEMNAAMSKQSHAESFMLNSL